jgi:large subunit ribosomal protein L6
MSKIGKKPIPVPSEVQVEVEKNKVTIKGPQGTGVVELPEKLVVEFKDNELVVEKPKSVENGSALYGLSRTLVANMVEGVVKKWEKVLEIHGVGYKGKLEAGKLNLALGYSHPVIYQIPIGVEIAIKGNKIVIQGIDKQFVGEVAAKIKSFKKPDKYKGKGIRYQGEVLKLKPGKKAKTAA